MTFSVGDHVVHPQYGPGRIASVARRELLNGEKRYYVIDIPDRELTVFVPVHGAEEAGIRPAMPRSRLPEVLDILRSAPRQLPEDYKERQALMLVELQAGRVMHLAQLVRDLTWHGARLHLTKKDTDYLRQGQDLLAAEMALAMGQDMAAVSHLIADTMTAAVADRTANPLSAPSGDGPPSAPSA